MGIPIPVKQWFQRKQKHYKLATDEYLVRLRGAITKDTDQKLHRLKEKSITVLIGGGDNKTSTIINGITVERCNLPEARVDERIFLIQSGTKKQVHRGTVLSVNLQEVKIKLDEPLKVASKEPEDKNDDREDVHNNERVDSLANNSKRSEYKVVFDKQSVTERRKQIEFALHKFKQVSCSLPIHKCLLGNYKDWSNVKYDKTRVMLPTNGLAIPKGFQMLAVEQSMKKRISLVEGVAGSGKTLVAANIAYSASRLRKRKILLCSPIQATVDRLAMMIDQTEGLLVVQLPPGRTHNTTNTTTCSLHIDSESNSSRANRGNSACLLDTLVKENIYRIGWNRYEQSLGKIRKREMLMHKQASKMVANCSTWLKRKVERDILLRADVVCCTLLQVSTHYLKGIAFDMLIIDDAQVASEVDCMMPMMMKGLKQVTLLSDMRRGIRLAKCNQAQQRQLNNNKLSEGKKPIKADVVIKSVLRRTKRVVVDDERKEQSRGIEFDVKQAREPGGLFERLLSIGLTSVALNHQYRMHETLAAFPNHHFYSSRLKTDPETTDRLTSQICKDLILGEDRFIWLPNNKCLTALFDAAPTKDTNSIDDTLRDIINKLVLSENVHESRIGIISNDRACVCQRFGGVRVGTIEEFFGQERDFIILSCVLLSTKDRTVSGEIETNYLKSDTALNVALTRARLGLFIVADLKNLANKELLEEGVSQITQVDCCNSWREMIKYYHANKLVI